MSKNDLNNGDDDIENTILAMIFFFLLQLGKLLFH